MKKVLIVLPGMYYGGMERVAMIARKLLIKAGYYVRVVILYKGDPDYKPDFHYDCLNCEIREGTLGKILTEIKRTIKLKQYKKRLSPDIVISYGKNSNFCNAFSKCGEKLILGIRSYDWLYQYLLNYRLEKLTYSRCDKVVSVSRLIQVDAEKKFDIPSEKSEYLYNPYNLNEIERKSRELITEINIPNDKKIIVTAGRIENQKGFYHLVKSISLIREKEQIRIYVMGHGSKQKDLEKLIEYYNLGNIIHLIGGQQNPYKFMKRADLYVMTSITEGFPNAMVEAMSLGTPILTSDCKSGPREILTNSDIHKITCGIEYGDYGILTSPMTDSGDYTPNIEQCDIDFSKALEQVINNEELLSKYGVLAQKRALDFSYKAFSDKLIGIIEN